MRCGNQGLISGNQGSIMGSLVEIDGTYGSTIGKQGPFKHEGLAKLVVVHDVGHLVMFMVACDHFESLYLRHQLTLMDLLGNAIYECLKKYNRFLNEVFVRKKQGSFRGYQGLCIRNHGLFRGNYWLSRGHFGEKINNWE